MRRALPPFLAAVCLALVAVPCMAQIALVAGPNSPIRSLSRDQAEQFYLGRARSLPDGVPIALVDLPAGEIRDRFYELLTGKNPSRIRAYWSRQVFTGRALPPREAESVDEAIAWVVANPNLIAYVPEPVPESQVRVLLRLP